MGTDAQRLRRDRRHPRRGCCASSPNATNRSPNGSTSPGAAGRRRQDQALLETRTSKHELDDFATLEGRMAHTSRPTRLGTCAARPAPAANAPRLRAVEDGVERWIDPRHDTGAAGESTAVVRERSASRSGWTGYSPPGSPRSRARSPASISPKPSLPTCQQGPRWPSIDATVNRALASAAIVQVGDHWRRTTPVRRARTASCGDDRELRYTSRSLLAVEATTPRPTRRRARRRASAGLDPTVVEVAIETSTLGADQAHAIRVAHRARATG